MLRPLTPLNRMTTRESDADGQYEDQLKNSCQGMHMIKGLVTNYGEEGGHVKLYFHEKGGGKSFSHAEEGAQNVLVSFLCGSLKF